MLRALRTLRALRPLRIASTSEQLRVVIQALFSSLKSLVYVGIVCVLFYLLFGILGERARTRQHTHAGHLPATPLGHIVAPPRHLAPALPALLTAHPCSGLRPGVSLLKGELRYCANSSGALLDAWALLPPGQPINATWCARQAVQPVRPPLVTPR
jgi:hypothetical protein